MNRMLLWIYLGGVIANAATVISFEPLTQVATVGQQVSVDVILSQRPTTIGSFDIDVSFDAAVLTGAGAVFYPFLGDVASGQALTDMIISTGVINVASVSLLFDPMELDALQPDTFPLARLIFDVVRPGTTALTITREDIDDFFGAKLPVTTGEGRITGVPEAGSLPLLGVGLSTLAGLTVRSRRRA